MVYELERVLRVCNGFLCSMFVQHELNIPFVHDICLLCYCIVLVIIIIGILECYFSREHIDLHKQKQCENKIKKTN